MRLIVVGERAVGPGASRGACVPVDEVEFHAPRHGERGEQRRDRERGARAHPSSRLCRAGVINHPRAPVTCPPHLPGASWHPSAWREMSNSAAPGGAPGRMAAPSSYEGWAHAVKPTIESRLADAEAELAFLRADNGRVARENARLRGQCERLSAEMAMLSEDPEAQARQLRRGLMGARRRDGSDVDLASTADAAARDRPPRASSREDRQLSLFLTDGKGALTERKVPGIVSAPPGVLQFGVVQAEVASTGFVGLRPLGTNDAVNTASTSTSSVSAKMKSLMAGVLGAAGGSASPTARGRNRRRHRTRPTRRRDRRTRSCGRRAGMGVKTQPAERFEGSRLNATPTRLSTSGNRSGRGQPRRWRDQP